MTYTREIYVRHRYFRVDIAQEMNEWTATSPDLPLLHARGANYRLLVQGLPAEIELIVPEPGTEINP